MVDREQWEWIIGRLLETKNLERWLADRIVLSRLTYFTFDFTTKITCYMVIIKGKIVVLHTMRWNIVTPIL